MSKPASIFAGGWTPANAAVHFSKKQQMDLKQHLAQSEKAKSPIAEVICCRACSEKAVHELTCSICGEPKSLDGFSKAQRKDPDHAYRFNSDIDTTTSALKAASLSEHDKMATKSDLSGPYGGSGKGKGKEKENNSEWYAGSTAPSVTYSKPPAQKGGFANPPRGLPQHRPDDIIDQLKAKGAGRVVNYSDEDTDSDGSFGML
ncbi:MAG: hypothetical protein Q9213_001884 [Squamulea squamosa]